MAPPVLGSIMMLLLVGIILPERIGRPYSTAMRQLVDKKMVKYQPTMPKMSDNDNSLFSCEMDEYRVLSEGVHGMLEHDLEADGPRITCLHCHGEFSHKEVAFTWRRVEGSGHLDQIHVHCMVDFTHSEGAYQTALGGLDMLFYRKAEIMRERCPQMFSALLQLRRFLLVRQGLDTSPDGKVKALHGANAHHVQDTDAIEATPGQSSTDGCRVS